MRHRIAILAALFASPLTAQTIALNQLGFHPLSHKRAILAGAGSSALRWEVQNADGRVVQQGITQPLGQDAASGQMVQLIEFGGLQAPGAGYRLKIGQTASDSFAIDSGLYRPLSHDALAYFYHNRASVPIEARYAGGERWARPAGHPDEVAGCFSGKDQKGNTWPGCRYRLDVAGGWYDAGDHGKYVVNGGISLWTLLNLYERLPLAFPDGCLPIPEAGNGASDLLDHARWQMEFMLKMQVPDGERMALPVGQATNERSLDFTDVDAGGMAHHKIADEKWTALPLRPDQDREKRVLHAPSTAATLNLAATAAQCARVWRTIDPAFSARCLAAAERAWNAAVRNPAIYAVGDFAGSGSYGDGDVSDEFYWAAAELFASTGRPLLAEVVRQSRHFAQIGNEPAWPSTAPLGSLTLAFSETGLAADEVAKLRAAILAAAGRFEDERKQSGYRIPFASTAYDWGSNSNLLNRAIVLAAAHDLTGEARYRDATVDVMDYILGRNPLGVSYVSGTGARPMRNPHHRFWAQSLDPAFPPPPPGALSSGPNNTAMVDDVARKLAGKCAPQKCWADDAHAYALNEVAINWNAPLVWVATWLDSKR